MNIQFFHRFSWFADNLSQLRIEQVAMAMKNSQVVLVFVSDDFVEDEHCKRLFQFAKVSHVFGRRQLLDATIRSY